MAIRSRVSDLGHLFKGRLVGCLALYTSPWLETLFEAGWNRSYNCVVLVMFSRLRRRREPTQGPVVEREKVVEIPVDNGFKVIDRARVGGVECRLEGGIARRVQERP
jgi:hypothetical protein